MYEEEEEIYPSPEEEERWLNTVNKLKKLEKLLDSGVRACYCSKSGCCEITKLDRSLNTVSFGFGGWVALENFDFDTEIFIQSKCVKVNV